MEYLVSYQMLIVQIKINKFQIYAIKYKNKIYRSNQNQQQKKNKIKIIQIMLVNQMIVIELIIRIRVILKL